MEIEFDDTKRTWTLASRGLDMADAGAAFASPHMTVEDDRIDYGERRFITVGRLAGRMVVFGLDAARRGAPYYQYEKSQ